MNIRVIAATNRNLQEAIANKTFRDDLYYRLNVFEINVPPLRERPNDIPLLTDYFLSKYTSTTDKWVQEIAPEVYEIFSDYPWPGNVRELENIMERAVLVCEGNRITLEDLPSALTAYRSSYSAISTTLPMDVLSDSTSFLTSAAKGPGNQEPTINDSLPFNFISHPSSTKDFNAQNQSLADISTPHSSGTTFAQMEKEMILRTLKNNAGNVKKTAADLGISRRTLYRRIHQYEIYCPDLRKSRI